MHRQLGYPQRSILLIIGTEEGVLRSKTSGTPTHSEEYREEPAPLKLAVEPYALTIMVHHRDAVVLHLIVEAPLLVEIRPLRT